MELGTWIWEWNVIQGKLLGFIMEQFILDHFLKLQLQ